MPRNALSYVERDADRELYEGLRAGQFCYVLTSRQMGKSSLMVRTAARLREEGCAVAVLDLTAVGQNLNAEQWYDGLLNLLARSLELDDELEDFWLQNRRLGPLQRWMQALHDVVLAKIPGRIVLFLEEIDAVRSLPFSADEFFAAIRECYNRRTEDPDYHRLTFCLLGVATPSDLIQDTRTTPFNIGRRITLADFEREEAKVFAGGFWAEGVTLPTDDKAYVGRILERILYWTGGHPYLTQRLCRVVVDHLRDTVHPPQGEAELVDQICNDLFLSPTARDREDNLIFVRERLLRSEVDRASLLTLYRQVREERRVEDDETNPLVSMLHLSGIVRTENRRLVVRNPIYAQVFDKAWIIENMPDGELRRQQAAYRRGALRTASLAGAVLLVMIALVGFALRQAYEATTARAEALHNLKAANQEKERANGLTRSVQNANTRLEAALEQSKQSLSLAEKRQKQAMAATKKASLAEASARTEAARANQAAYRARIASVQARDEAETTRLTLYAAQVARAQATYDAGLAPQARHLLDALRPKAGQKDLRGFEWRYLWQQSADASRQTFHDGDQTVSAIAISPNGKYLAAGIGSAVVLRNLKTGTVAATLGGLYGPVRSLAFSPGGRLLAIASGTVAVVRDLTTERDVFTQDGGTDINFLAFSPNGERLALATPTEIKILEVQSRQQVGRIATGVVSHRFAFTPEGKRLLVGRKDGIVQVWDPTTANLLESFRADTNDIEALTLSADGELLATSTQTGKIKLWNLNPPGPDKERERKPLATLDGHAGRVLALAFAPDSKTLATAGFDGVLRLWDVAARTQLRSLLGHPAAIESMAFTPEGTTIATGGRGGLVKLWNAEQQATQTVVRLPDRNSNQLAPNGARIASFRSDGNIFFSELLKGDTDQLSGSLPGTPFTPAFSSDSRAVYRRVIQNGYALTGWDGTVTRATTPAQQLFYTFNSPTIARYDRTAKLLILTDTLRGVEVGRIAAPQSPLTVEFSEDGSTAFLLFAEENKRVRLDVWDRTTRRVRTLTEETGSVEIRATARDGSRVALRAIADQQIAIWDVQQQSPLWRFTQESEAMRFTSDLSYVAFRRPEDRVVVRNLASRRSQEISIGKGAIDGLLANDGQTFYIFRLQEGDRHRWQLERRTLGSSTARVLASGVGKPHFLSTVSSNKLLYIVALPAQKKALFDPIMAVEHDLGTGQKRQKTFPNGDMILSVSRGGILHNRYNERLVRTEVSGATRTLGTLPDNYVADAIAPGETQAFAHYRNSRDGQDTPVALIDLPTGKSVSQTLIRAPLRYAMLSPGGQYLYAQGDNRSLVWERKTGVRRVAQAPADVVPMTFSPDERYLALWRATDVLILDNATGNIRFTLRGHTDTVDNIRWSGDGKYLATCGSDRTICIWDTQTGTLVSLLQGHPGRVTSAAFSHDQRTLASFGDEGTVRLWNLATRQEVARFAAGTAGTMSLDFTEGDQALVLVNYSEATARVWRAPTLRETDSGSSRPTPKVAVVSPPEVRRVVISGNIESPANRTTPNLIPYQGRSVAWTGLWVDKTKGVKATTVNEGNGATRVNIVRGVSAEGSNTGRGTNSAGVAEIPVVGDPFPIALGVNDFPVEGEVTYELRFRARADKERSLGIRLESRQPEYTAYIRQNVTLTSTWQTYRFTAVTPGGLKRRIASLNFGTGQAAGTIWLADISLRQVRTASSSTARASSNILLNGKGGISWFLSQDANNSAIATWKSEGKGVERITVHENSTPERQVHLSIGPLDMIPGRSYVLTFYARADANRRLPVGVRNFRTPGEFVGPERLLDITTQWQEFRLPFRVGNNAVRKGGSITFDAGFQKGTLWLGNVKLLPLEEGNTPTTVDLLPQRGRNTAWNLETDPDTGARGEITDLPDGTTQIKVRTTGWQEWNVRTTIPLPTLRPNGRYLLSFDARADKSRPITVRMQHDRPAWEELGLYQRPQLTSAWQQFRWEFVTPPTTEVGHGSMVLGVTQATGTIEIRNAHLIAFDDPTPTERMNVREPLETVSGRDVIPKMVRNIIAKIPWVFNCDVRSGAAATRRQESDGTTRVDITAVRPTPGDDLGITLNRSPLTLQPGIRYTLRFRAKADRKRLIRALTHTSLGNGAYVPLDTGRTFPLTTEWKQYSYTFIPARSPNPGQDALLMVLGQTTGTVWVTDVQLSEGDDNGK